MDARTTMFKKIFSFVLIVSAITFTFAGSSNNLLAEETAPRPEAAGVTVDDGFSQVDAMFSKADEHGSVRVIVGFDVGFRPEGALLSEAQIENQRLSIDVAQDIVLNSLASHDIRNARRFKYIPYMALEVDEAGLDALLSNPNIVSIHEDAPLFPVLDESVPRIGAPEVWDWYATDDGFDGTGIAVAVLDTGVKSNHQFLDKGKVVSEACYSSTTGSPYNSKTACPNGRQSQTGSGAGKNCPTSWDGCDHGTHVAGIVAGADGPGDRNGVAKGAGIIAVQVFSKFTGAICYGSGYSSPCVASFTSDQIDGLERVYELRNKFNIAAVNMSLGGSTFTSPCNGEPQKAIIDTLRAAGIATVIASGNNGLSNAISTPACISSAVSVGATTVPSPDEAVASFSNHAYFLDLLAPGVSIYSSVATSKSAYAIYSGTSMAAPHVAGAFALLRQANYGAGVGDIENALKNNPGITLSKNGNPKPRIDVAAALGELGVVRPTFTFPVPGTTINASPVDFSWTPDGAAVTKWKLWVGSAPGKKDIYNSGKLDQATTNMPVDCVPLLGDKVYARLWFKIGITWWYIDYEFLTANNSPAMTGPANPLSDTNVTFEWDDNGLCVEDWKLWAGTTAGARDLYDSGLLSGATTSHLASGLPFDGSDVHVRLRYRMGGVWYSKDYVYEAVTWNVGITAPTPGTQLEGTAVLFEWDPDIAPVTRWKLWVGSGKGKRDYYNSGKLTDVTTGITADNLPFDGRKLFVRLKFKIYGVWRYVDYQYTAVDTLPKILTPSPGDTLGGFSVAFTWTAGIPTPHKVKKWRLRVGSAKGKNNYFDSGKLDDTQLGLTCNVVPTDGTKIHVTLKYLKGGSWKSRYYKYIAANLMPTITAPAGPSLTDTAETFQWAKNNAYIRKFRLMIGSKSGEMDVYDSGKLPGSTLSHPADGLPFDGRDVYVRLKYKSGVKWKYVESVYAAVNTAPAITTPVNLSTLTHSTVEFGWDSQITVEKYRLMVGKKKGRNNVYDSGVIPGAAAPHSLTHTVHNLLINSKMNHVRLKFKVGGVWYKKDYKYTGVWWNFKMSTPTPGSRFSGSTVTFSWTGLSSPVDEYKLRVGKKRGGGDIYSGSVGLATSRTVYGIPVNGRNIFVRLFARYDEDWHHKDYQYKAYSNITAHRFTNLIGCNNKPVTATLTVCGTNLVAKSPETSNCITKKTSSCLIEIYAYHPQCGTISGSFTQSLDGGCIYDWVLLISGGYPAVGYIKKCPGNCSSPLPASTGDGVIDPVTGEQVTIIKTFTGEEGFNFIE